MSSASFCTQKRTHTSSSAFPQTFNPSQLSIIPAGYTSSAFAISQSSFFWLPWDLWAFRQSCNFTVQKPINNKNFFKIYLSGQHCLRSNHQTTDISTFWVCAEQCRALHFSPDFFVRERTRRHVIHILSDWLLIHCCAIWLLIHY